MQFDSGSRSKRVIPPTGTTTISSGLVWTDSNSSLRSRADIEGKKIGTVGEPATFASISIFHLMRNEP